MREGEISRLQEEIRRRAEEHEQTVTGEVMEHCCGAILVLIEDDEPPSWDLCDAAGLDATLMATGGVPYTWQDIQVAVMLLHAMDCPAMDPIQKAEAILDHDRVVRGEFTWPTP